LQVKSVAVLNRPRQYTATSEPLDDAEKNWLATDWTANGGMHVR